MIAFAARAFDCLSRYLCLWRVHGGTNCPHFVGNCGWQYPLFANICVYGNGWELLLQIFQHNIYF